MRGFNKLKSKLAFAPLLSLNMILFGFFGCDKAKKTPDRIKLDNDASTVIEIVTNNMDFVVQDTISSGWHTFRYMNNSNETHFFLLDKYPEGFTIADTEKEIGPVFQKGMDLINEGKAEEGFAVFQSLPEWFFKVVFVGGSGLVSPRTSSLTSIKLEPGYYIIECYVKMPNGNFHSSMGMAKSLIVTDEISEEIQPKATAKIELSSKDGIQFMDTIARGKQIFSVTFIDQITHENFVGHDINLVKVGEDADLEELELWLNWAHPKGLITPAPKGFTFLGGVNDMPGGSIGYFEVDLMPGNYLLISEVPMALKKNLFKSFVITN